MARKSSGGGELAKRHKNRFKKISNKLMNSQYVVHTELSYEQFSDLCVGHKSRESGVIYVPVISRTACDALALTRVKSHKILLASSSYA